MSATSDVVGDVVVEPGLAPAPDVTRLPGGRRRLVLLAGPTSVPAVPSRVRPAVVVGGLTGLALALRLPTIGRAAWIDEGISVGIASHPLRDIPHLLRLDGSPPLYYVLLHFWMEVFGRSVPATHALSLAVSVLVVPLAWWCAGTLFGAKPALCAAALAATNPFLAWYGTETRMYTIVCGLGMVAVTLTIRASQRRSWIDGIGAVAAFAALLYTHDWGFYLLGTTAIVMAARALVKRCPAEVLVVAAGAGTVAVLFMPWVPTLLYQASHTAAPWAVSPSLGSLFVDPAGMIAGGDGLFVAVVVPLLGAAAALNFVVTRREGVQPALAAGAIALTTLVIGWCVAQVEPSWTGRYLGVVVGVLLVALAGILGRNRLGRAVVAVTALVLSVLTVWGPAGVSSSRFIKSNAAAIDAEVAPWLGPGDVVMVTQTEQTPVVSQSLPAGLHYVTPAGPVRDPGVVDWRDLLHRLSLATPCRALGPAVAKLRVGGHLLVMNSDGTIGAPGSRWTRTVSDQINAVNSMATRDPALRLTRTFRSRLHPKPYTALSGRLFTKTSNVSSPCSAPAADGKTT